MSLVSENQAISQENEAISQESEALGRHNKAVGARIDAMNARPRVAGAAADAVRHEELQATTAELERITAGIDALRARADALRARADALTARIQEWPAHAPGFYGWFARRHWAWGVVWGAMVYAVPAVSWARAGGGPREEFFRSAAEVIPVLVLALALEGRHFDWSASRLPIVRAVNIMALLSLVAGEVAAFAVLSNGRVTRLESGLTTAALLSAAGMLVIMAVAGPARRPD